MALLATLAASAVHALTFTGRAYYSVLLLLPALFVVWPLVLWQWRRVPRKNLSSEIFGDVPRWMKIGLVALLAYAFANFFVCRSLNEGGAPDRRSDGSFVLADGPRVIRTLDLAEFRAARAVQVRQVSGFLVVILGLATFLAEVCWIKNGTAMADRDVAE